MTPVAATLVGALLAGVPVFEPPIDIAFPTRHFPTQPAVADFDHDGRLDLLVPGRDTGGVAFLLRGVANGFAAPESVQVGCQSDWAVAVDLDGDGHVDVALAARATPGGVVLLRSRGDGSFEEPRRISLERETRCVQVMDADGDGRADLLLAHYGSGAVMILHNDGDMRFSPQSAGRLNRWTLGTAAPSVVFAPDLDGDGVRDVLDLAGGSGRIDLRWNRGGLMGAERAWSVPVESTSAAGIALATMADLNRDGREELIAPGIVSDRGNPLFVWSFGADGTALDVRRFPGIALGSAWSAATGDLDGDGDLDVIAMSVNDGCISVFENRGAAGASIDLASPVQVLVGTFLRHVVPIDFDHDGRLDLVVCDFLSHRVRLLRNAGGSALQGVGDASRARARQEIGALDGVDEAASLLDMGPALQRPELQPSATSDEVVSRLIGTCGPPAGDCNGVHAGPGCFTTPCCETVCAFDPDCCTVTWDADCVSLATTECRGMVCPSRGDCTAAHLGPGCESPECCERVRRIDPSCTSVWDELCVELVPLVCVGEAPALSVPADAVDEGEACYQSRSEGCGRRSDPAHAPLVVGQSRRGVITGDGVRDVDAHVLQVDERRRMHIELHADFPAQLVLAQGPCDGPLLTLDEALASPGGQATIDRTLEPGEYRVTVGMAVATRTLRYGQPCTEVNPDTGPQDPPPVPGYFHGVWWMRADAGASSPFGDVDGSGHVDFGDVALVLLGMGDSDPQLDVDGNGIVDFGDVALVLISFTD